MTPDFRSDPMPSAEGSKGRARKAWDAYARAVNKVSMPGIDYLAKKLSLAYVEDLVGFYVIWHLHGGFDGLERMGYPRSTVYRKAKRFRTVFGEHVDDYQFPGMRLDVRKYMEAGRKMAEAKRKRQQGGE